MDTMCYHWTTSCSPRHGYFDYFVGRQGEYRSRGEYFLCCHCTIDDLEKHRNGRWSESCIINGERRPIKSDLIRQIDVGSSRYGDTRRSRRQFAL